MMDVLCCIKVPIVQKKVMVSERFNRGRVQRSDSAMKGAIISSSKAVGEIACEGLDHERNVRVVLQRTEIEMSSEVEAKEDAVVALDDSCFSREEKKPLEIL